MLGTSISPKISQLTPFTVELPHWQNLPYREVTVFKIEYAASSRVSFGDINLV
jgi:hypothetical protein